MYGFPRPLGSLLPAALGLVLLSMPRPAAASGDYPGRIATKFDVDPPACTICHRDLNGGSGTVVQAFGQGMVANGLGGGSAANFEDLLDQTGGRDSDGDGQNDLAELQAGTNPSLAGASADLPPATYGCFETKGTVASAPPGSPRLASTAVAGLLAGFLFFRRRR